MGRVGEKFDLANLEGKTIGAQRATLALNS